MNLRKPEFPRSAGYEEAWMLENQMGPNALWLTEWLTESLALESNMKVLDLGCGKAMSSIFVAKEFGCQVFAADLWMSPEGNAERAREAGVGDLVHPIKAEAHSLPFAADFFDAVISVDAYHYFGTDELYLHYLATKLRPGGQLGVVVPGLVKGFESGEAEGDPLIDGVPKHLVDVQENGKVFWEPTCWCIKTAGFWQALWQRCPLVENPVAEMLPDGCRHWAEFERALVDFGVTYPSDLETLERDRGRYLGFVRVTARRNQEVGMDLYDGNLGKKVGVEE